MRNLDRFFDGRFSTTGTINNVPVRMLFDEFAGPNYGLGELGTEGREIRVRVKSIDCANAEHGQPVGVMVNGVVRQFALDEIRPIHDGATSYLILRSDV